MLIGNGILANEFYDYIKKDEFIIFASGVSNSEVTNIDEFNREKTLLINTIKESPLKKIVYFSTCSMYDTYFENNDYVMHKLNMENLLIQHSNNYNIFRLPQVVGKNNKFQLLGFLFDRISNGILFNLYDIERNLIGISDVKIIVDYILCQDLFKNKIINIANPQNIKVIDLVKKIEKYLGKKAKYNLIQKEGCFKIDVDMVSDIYNKKNIFDEKYINKLLEYYEK